MTDEELVRQFFLEAKHKTIADEGFTERVMSHLPTDDATRRSRWWTLFCVAVFVVLFASLGGWQLVGDTLQRIALHQPSWLQVLTLPIAAAVVGLLSVDDLLRQQRIRL